jgi:hypothetical protein
MGGEGVGRASFKKSTVGVSVSYPSYGEYKSITIYLLIMYKI